MQTKKFLRPRKVTYTRLFISLIILLFLSPLVENRPGSLLMSFCFLLTNILTLESICLPFSGFFLLIILAIISFIFDVFYLDNYARLNTLLSLIAYVSYTLFITGAIVTISMRIFAAKKVNNDILIGGICVYLLIGILWVLFYTIVELLFGNSFSFITDNNLNIRHQILYFSFTTLTTLGYGDVTPIAPLSMVLSNAEAIIGQMYPSIFIARLVSLYINEDNKSN